MPFITCQYIKLYKVIISGTTFVPLAKNMKFNNMNGEVLKNVSLGVKI